MHKVAQDMYNGSLTAVKTAVGMTKEFGVKVGLRQGSALRLFLFAIVMDRMIDEIRKVSPWDMLFADNIAFCTENRDVQNISKKRRQALESRGMKISGSKTEFMVVNEKCVQESLQGVKIRKAEGFKYLESTIQCNGDCNRKVKNRVQAGLNG